MKRWVGVDPGEKRTGLARSDALGMLARPTGIVATHEELLATLNRWASELEGVIVGLPRNMDGSYGPLAERTFELVRRLRSEIDLDIRLWDERLTTRQARSMTGKRKSRGEHVDDAAAAILLQSFLDAGRPPVPDPDVYARFIEASSSE